MQNSGRSCANCSRPFSNKYGDAVWFECGLSGCQSTVAQYWYTDPYYSCAERLAVGGPCCNYDLCRGCYLDRPDLCANAVHRMVLLSHTFCKGHSYCRPNTTNFPADRDRAHTQVVASTPDTKCVSMSALCASTNAGTQTKPADTVATVDAEWRLFMRSQAPRRRISSGYVDCASRSPTAWRVVRLESCGTQRQAYYLLGSIEAFVRDFSRKLALVVRLPAPLLTRV